MENKENQIIEVPKMKFVFDTKKITPAKIDKSMIDFEVLEKEVSIIEDLKNLVFNSVEDAQKYRLEVAGEKSTLEDFKKALMNYLNAETNEYNQKLISYINRVESVRKYLHNKEKELDTARKEKIKSTKNFIFKDRLNYLVYLIENPKWENKTFSDAQLESEIQEQYNKLIKKEEFINEKLKQVNDEIMTTLVFEEFKYLLVEEYPKILEKIEEKKQERIQVEERIKEKAEEQARKDIEESMKQNQKEQSSIQEDIQQNKNKKVYSTSEPIQKSTYINIKVSGLNKEAVKELKKVLEKYKIEYIKEEKWEN